MSVPAKILIGLLLLAGVATAGVHLAHHVNRAMPGMMTVGTSTMAGMMTATTSGKMTAEPAQASSSMTAAAETSGTPTMAQLALRTDADWKEALSPDQFLVLRKQGTEQPYTSPLLHETRAGTFVTADCGEPVFRSDTKFDSGTGWPSFYAPIKGAVVIKEDNSSGLVREEVETPICHSHLGHLFHDAPQTPTGDRYCINGVALKFVPDPGQ